jgi:diadenylate cyclase
MPVPSLHTVFDTAFQWIAEDWNSAIEIFILAVGIYYAYLYFRGTRGARVLTGLALFLVTLTLLSEALNLVVIRWLIGRYSVFLVVALVVIFQPELRRAFAELGSRSLFSTNKQNKRTLDRLCDCVLDLASKQFGALIAIERDIGLRGYAETGVDLDSNFSPELLSTIFHPKTALHDGGVILRDDRIVAAACIFPVSQRETLDRSFGLRHRAGLGISEDTDAVAVVVSEETGSISLCVGRRIQRGLSAAELRRRLGQILLFEPADAPPGPPEARAREADAAKPVSTSMDR